MYERLLKQAERYLGIKNDAPVPVKQLWDAMVKEGAKRSFAVPSLMADFECLLEGDVRFEFVAEGLPHGGRNLDIEELLEHEELEKLGFLTDQKVRLRRSAADGLDAEEESHDALDAAVSFEELGENYPDSSLMDADASNGQRKESRTSSRSASKTSPAGRGAKAHERKQTKPPKKASKKPVPNKRKK